MDLAEMVESYIDDITTRGRDYARERLSQKIAFSSCAAADETSRKALVATVAAWESDMRKATRKEQFGYRFIIGIAFASGLANIGIITNSSYSDTVRMIYCTLLAAGVLMCICFYGYDRSAGKQLRANVEIITDLRKWVEEEAPGFPHQ
jgi:hypothetical protein